jgi:primosomal protein N' (replication factor Y)
MKYADVILPLAVANTYTFGVPFELQSKIQVGCRVEVQFGKRKIYSGIVQSVHNRKPELYEVKPIRSILDENPLVTEQQIQYWQWIASYYMCTIGEVMSAALPSYLKLESETFVILNDEVNIDDYELSDDEFMVLQALQIRMEKQRRKEM